MDGHFVPNITIGPPVIESIRKFTSLPLDVHLMIENADRYIKSVSDAGADILSFQVEVTTNTLWNTRYSSYQSYLHNMITEMQGEGLGYRKIAKRLNKMGIKTARGKEFFPASVHSILKKKKIRDERINKKFDRKVSSLQLEYEVG